jgi:hypothetical protein
MSHECQCCCALHFIFLDQTASDKLFEICCKRGDAVLDPLRTPPAKLRALLEAQDPRGRAFRQNIRAYNGALTFTSMSYTKNSRLDLSSGLHCFQALDTARAASMQSQLNADQLSGFQQVVAAVTDDPQTAHFYLQGPGALQGTLRPLSESR